MKKSFGALLMFVLLATLSACAASNASTKEKPPQPGAAENWAITRMPRPVAVRSAHPTGLPAGRATRGE
jgi:hypothetical protein